MTGLSFHFDQPSSRAPQAILLAVPPTEERLWSLSALEAVVLEAHVEGEAGGLLTGRGRARAGLQFERMLAATGLGRYAAAYRAYPLEPPDEPADAATTRFFAVMGGRVPDGARLYNALSAARPALPPAPAVDAADVVRMVAHAQAWLDWAHSFMARPVGAPAWVPHRMEYAFGLEVAGVALEAEEHTDGRIDWYAFSAAGDGAAGNGGPSVTVIPAPVTYPGMPARRLWEFEDANVSFGDVQAHPEDLGRLLLTEFALVFGGDWLLPVEVPTGSLVRVRSLLVHDTFGQRVRIAPAPRDDGWRMFRLSPGGDPGLLVPLALVSALRGRDLEEVLLLRDEGANLAWAVERTVEGEHGLPVDRAQAAYASTPEPEAPRAESEAFTYRLMSEVPEHWLPLLPRREQPGEPAVELVVGVVDAPPHGRVLSPGAVLREEEVPREGARVTRGYRLARWVDGSTHLWLGRRKQVGRGEGSSGLRFDAMD
jgi:hypothetical protein